MAGWSALVNRVDDSIKWMERASERGWINYPLFNRDDPFLGNIREEPRFGAMMEKMKHEWETFEV